MTELSDDALYNAAYEGNLSKVNCLLEVSIENSECAEVKLSPDCPNTITYQGTLLCAVMHGASRATEKNNLENYIEIAKALIKFGATISQRDSLWGRNALHWAAFYNLVPFVSLFLKERAKNHTLFDINCLDYHEDTPLHLAAKQDSYASFYLLLKSGANLFCLNGAHISAGAFLFNAQVFCWDETQSIEEEFEQRKLTSQSMAKMYSWLEGKISVEYHVNTLQPLEIPPKQCSNIKVPDALIALMQNTNIFIRPDLLGRTKQSARDLREDSDCRTKNLTAYSGCKL